MFRGRRRRRGNPFRAIRALRRRVLPMVAKRVIFDSAVNTTGATQQMPLLVAQDSITEEDVSNGSTTANFTTGSSLQKIRLKLTLVNGAATGATFRVMLVKNIDQDFTADANTYLMQSTDTTTAREIRKATIWKDLIHVAGTGQGSAPNYTTYITLRGKRLSKINPFREQDRLEMWIYQASGSNASVNLFGTLYCTLN